MNKKPILGIILVAAVIFAGAYSYLTHSQPSAESTPVESTGEYPSWKEIMSSRHIEDDDCELRTANVTLSDIERTLVFDYFHCPLDRDPQYSGGGGSIIAQGVEAWAPNYSLFSSNQIIADYWILEPYQDAKAFLKKLIAVLPSEEEREHCIVKELESSNIYRSSPEEELYVIGPDDYLLEKMMEGADGIVTFCGAYGTGGSIRFFKELDDVLLYVRVGHEMYPPFDSSSFRLTER